MSPRKLLPSKPPRSSAVAFSAVGQVVDAGWFEIPKERSFNGSGGPGRLLEDLLDIKEKNKDSPDLGDWELKFHGGAALITLFHKDPEPRGIIRVMVHDYGWNDAKGRISFRHTISGESDRGFYVVNETDRVVVRNKNKDAAVPHWTHDTLLNSIGAKLRRLIVVSGEVKKGPRRVRYTNAEAYWEFNLTGFCNALEKGIVCIDFDARTQQGQGSALRNHGTKFRVRHKDLKSLYKHSQKITHREG